MARPSRFLSIFHQIFFNCFYTTQISYYFFNYFLTPTWLFPIFFFFSNLFFFLLFFFSLSLPTSSLLSSFPCWPNAALSHSHHFHQLKSTCNPIKIKLELTACLAKKLPWLRENPPPPSCVSQPPSSLLEPWHFHSPWVQLVALRGFFPVTLVKPINLFPFGQETP